MVAAAELRVGTSALLVRESRPSLITTEENELHMADEITPTQEAVENLDEAVQEEAQAVEEVAEEIVEQISESVADSAETAQEAAAEAAQEVEETVSEAVEDHPALDANAHAEEVYNRVLNRLREEGHIPSPAIAEEIAGETEHPVEVVEQVAEDPAPATVVTRDRIAPTSEHPWYRPRKFFGRTI